MRQRHGTGWRQAGRQAEVPPLVLSHRENNTQRIAALNETAEALGLRPGMGIADARAMHPSIEVLEADPEADHRLLCRLADWCDHFTPLVALDGSDGLMLDISGCAHLFSGENALLRVLLRHLTRQGFDARAALASTQGMAWAAARFVAKAVPGKVGTAFPSGTATGKQGMVPGKVGAAFPSGTAEKQGGRAGRDFCEGPNHLGPSANIPPGGERDALAPMPLAALRIPPETVAKLESVGLRRVGALLDAPRGPLARRFGQLLVTRLDQALGTVEEAISPRFPVPPLSVERRLAEPVSLVEDIQSLLLLLAGRLKQDLERRGEGARQLTLSLFRMDGAVTRIAVSTSRPLRDPQAIGTLFAEKFAVLENSLDPGEGFELVRLAAASTAPFVEKQEDLHGDPASAGEERFALVVDRLRARLGDSAVLMPSPEESHMPEREGRFVAFRVWVESPSAARYATAGSAVLKPDTQFDAVPAALLRPLRLLLRPEPVEAAAEVPEGPPFSFRWRKALYRVVRAEGPERIEPEWWRMPAGTLPRDYFRVEDTEGRRFWLFREGIYDGGANPRWFMHGLFP